MREKWYRVLLRRRFFIVLLLLLQLVFIVYTLASTSLASAVVSKILTLVSLLACLYIISRKDKGGYKLTWVFMLLLFPVFGGLFYLIFNFQLTTKNYLKKSADVRARTEKLLFLPKADKICGELARYAPQVKYLQDTAGFPLYANTKTKYLSPGEEYFESLVNELKKAEKYIFLEYFIIHEGVMWNTLLDILKQKASSGVKVRVMYDDLGCFLLLPKEYPKILEEYGIECVVFNRFRPVLASLQNNRDHRKITVIDGKVAFTGGINIADEYINKRERFGHWKDAGVMLEGKGAWSLTMIFLRMWNTVSGKSEDYIQYYPWKDEPCKVTAEGYVQPYADSPLDGEDVSEQVYMQIINSASDYIYINTPYLILDDSMLSALCLAAKSGVDVRIIMPHKWDKWAVHVTSRSYYRELIESGVKIYEYTDGFNHSKTFVSDDAVATVGSANLDFRSLYLHFECGVRMYGTSSVAQLKDDFLQTLNRCREMTEADCKCSVPMRILQNVLRIIAPVL